MNFEGGIEIIFSTDIMGLRIDNLKQISDIEELKKIATLDELIAVIENEITPLHIQATSYEDLYNTLLVLKKHWDSFQNDPYFRNEGARYIFALTQMDGTKRNNMIHLTDDLYDDEDRAKVWYYSIAKKVHPDQNPNNIINAEDAMKVLKHIYNRIKKCFDKDEED